jgi:hypothetical protein
MKHILFFVMVTTIFTISSCSKKSHIKGEKITKHGQTYDAGVVISEIREIKQDTAHLALYGHARLFYLDLKMINSDQYIALIKAANKKRYPVRAKIFKDSYKQNVGEEVAEIYPPSAEDIKLFLKASKP